MSILVNSAGTWKDATGGGTGITSGTTSISPVEAGVGSISGSCAWWKYGKIVYVYGEFDLYDILTDRAYLSFTCTGLPAAMVTASFYNPVGYSAQDVQVRLTAGSTSIKVTVWKAYKVMTALYFSYLTSE